MSADAFYAPASHAIETAAEVEQPQAGSSSMGNAAATLSLDEAFDIPRTVQLILEGGYKTIGLQFPDDLLPSSVAVYRAIMRKVQSTGAQAYVLADSTYGACCPDVLSCLHLPADLLVHYGHACLTPTDAIPVHYVFPRHHINVAAAVQALKDASTNELKEKRGVVVVWDVAYDWRADEIAGSFAGAVDLPISFATIERPTLPKATPKAHPAAATEGVDTPGAYTACGSDSKCGTGSAGCGSNPTGCSKGKGRAAVLRAIKPPAGVEIADCVLWYLGDEGRSLLNLQMTHASNPLYSYNDADGARAIHLGSTRLLSKRLFAVHSAMAADVFGLVVGNIGLASSKPLVSALRDTLRRAGKKSYTLSVGRLNPAKLANFGGIECFVLIGCAEGGIVDSKDYFTPLITPYELTLALEPGYVWEPAKWTLDLGAVLDRAEAQGADGSTVNAADSDEELEFSLVTGAYRTKKTFAKSTGDHVQQLEGDVKDLTLRNTSWSLSTLESAGSNYLQTRHFQGLTPRYGQDEPSILEEGRSGIARGYTEETKGTGDKPAPATYGKGSWATGN